MLGLSDSPFHAIAPSNEQAVFVLAEHFDAFSKKQLFCSVPSRLWVFYMAQVTTTGEVSSPRQGVCMVPVRNSMTL